MAESLHRFTWIIDFLDIILVACVVYRLILFMKGSVAPRLLSILVVILSTALLARFAGLQTVNWLLDQFVGSLFLILVLIYQHDIRRALVTFSRKTAASQESHDDINDLVEEIVGAAEALATKKIGALIVFEREMPLTNFMNVGTEIDAKVTSELITSIFLPYSPIHDGAVFIQQGKLTKAGCFLPLTQDPEVSKSLGTRHRAAIGLTELVDAAVLVVSEETGKVSVVVGGRITRDLEGPTLRKVLRRLLETRR